MSSFLEYGDIDNARRPLEDIFREKNDNLLVRLKKLNEDNHLHHDEELKLKSVSGIENSSVLANAIDLGITAETFSAINLVPLVRVAMADRRCDQKEKNMILRIARGSGIEKDSASYELLEHWLETDFNPNLTIAWKSYLKSLKTRMPEIEYRELKKEVLYKCKKVARTSGSSVMGLGPLCKKEANAIKDVEASF